MIGVVGIENEVDLFLLRFSFILRAVESMARICNEFYTRFVTKAWEETYSAREQEKDRKDYLNKKERE